jgi:hypothetical protein
MVKMRIKQLCVYGLLVLTGVAECAVENFDLVVYGGTAGGVMTAVSGARQGLKTVLLEPGSHLGGMVSGGLSLTDYGNKEVIGGYALEFYRLMGAHYGMRAYGNDLAWYHEPHVAERAFERMLDEAGVQVKLGHRLVEKNGVRKQGTTIEVIRMENGAEFSGSIFADCSYEGDLMAQAGVSYTWGRESSAQYGESLAGVRPTHYQHVFKFPVRATGADGKILPEIQSQPRGEIGQGDKKVQSYNFRVCVSSDPANQVAFPKPAKYSSERFQLLLNLLHDWQKHTGRPPVMDDFFIVGKIPRSKADINNKGAFSTDYLGMNWDYPEASYVRRKEILDDHLNYTAALFYFLANDSRVPRTVRETLGLWGLCRDEFADTGHWPHQLYVREARRMTGEYVMTQKDIQEARTKPDPIAMGSYNSDSHAVQRIVQEDGAAQNEGLMEVPVQPYQIPYRILLPKASEATNLLVPVAFSASHVAYSTLRMEPQYMMIGQAAGVAAKLAIQSRVALQKIDTAALRSTLTEQGTVFEYHPVPEPRRPRPAKPPASKN